MNIGASMIFKTDILFGVNSIESLPRNCKFIGKKFLIVSTFRTPPENNVIKNIEKGLEKEHLSVITLTDFSPDPRSHEINEAASLLKKNKFDAVIGIGGGSSIDSAKAIAALLGEGLDDIERWMGTGNNPQNVLPIVAVPTTSGTGSEVTAGAIITRSKDDLKIGIRSNMLIPKLAILDPNLTLTCPKKLTRDAGFDIFSHAFESYVSKKSNPISEEISMNAIDITLRCLPLVLDNLKDITLRSKLMFACLLAGMNLLNVGTCLPHRIQYAFGVPVKTTHAQGLAIIYRSWLERLYTVKKLDRLSKLFQCKETPEAVIESVQNFMDEIGFKRDYSDLSGFPDMDIFTQRLYGNLENDTIYSPQMIKTIYNEIITKN
jgi:alcohol dehydrogenase class IV